MPYSLLTRTAGSFQKLVMLTAAAPRAAEALSLRSALISSLKLTPTRLSGQFRSRRASCSLVSAWWLCLSTGGGRSPRNKQHRYIETVKKGRQNASPFFVREKLLSEGLAVFVYYVKPVSSAPQLVRRRRGRNNRITHRKITSAYVKRLWRRRDPGLSPCCVLKPC